MTPKGYWCTTCKRFVADDWAAHVLADEGTPEKVMIRTVRELIEAGDAIRCYPSGAVGFDDWSDAMAMAEFVLASFLDEEGDWHPMEPPQSRQHQPGNEYKSGESFTATTEATVSEGGRVEPPQP